MWRRSSIQRNPLTTKFPKVPFKLKNRIAKSILEKKLQQKHPKNPYPSAPSSISSEESFDMAYAHARKSTDRNLIETVEKEIIQRALTECGGNQVKASALLGITRATLRKRIDVFEIRY